MTLTQHGDVSGASIGSGVRTYYPSISVDANSDFAIGFSASGPNNYASAYYEAYKYNATTNTWTLESPTLLAGGVAPYYRTFGGGDNRWGDYSSIVNDPSSASTFWVYNGYAWTQGTRISGETGRWATQVGEFTLPNTTTGPVVSSSTTTGSSQTTGSTSPSTASPGLSQLAQIESVAHWQTSDINPNVNPLVETDHGPGIGASAWQLAQTNGMGHRDGSDINWNANPLVETDHGPGIGGSTSNPGMVVTNLFKHNG